MNGYKTFITNVYIADFVCCAVRKYKGTPKDGIHLLLIDKTLDAFTIGQPFDKVGLRDQNTCELFFEEIKVSKSKFEAVLGIFKGTAFCNRMLCLQKQLPIFKILNSN